MPNRKKYSTPEEKMDAVRASRRKYYQEHKETIKQRVYDHRAARKAAKEAETQTPQ